METFFTLIKMEAFFIMMKILIKIEDVFIMMQILITNGSI